MLMVIFGAGASFDSCPTYQDSSGALGLIDDSLHIAITCATPAESLLLHASNRGHLHGAGVILPKKFRRPKLKHILVSPQTPHEQRG